MEPAFRDDLEVGNADDTSGDRPNDGMAEVVADGRSEGRIEATEQAHLGMNKDEEVPEKSCDGNCSSGDPSGAPPHAFRHRPRENQEVHPEYIESPVLLQGHREIRLPPHDVISVDRGEKDARPDYTDKEGEDKR